jgi:3,4-dihydroxy 2-butanone 4-phosphate synthase/GTP cyclohydrolase II
VLVADDTHRENEVDVVLAAQSVSDEWIAWTVNHTSGYLCVPMTGLHADKLDLPLMVSTNQDSLRTAYCVSVDAAHGVTTGISARDRALTARVLASPNAVPGDLIRPGHMLPLRAVEGGILERPGHTEASVDLCRLAGLEPVGVIAELVNPDGSMMRLVQAREFALREDVPLATIAQIIQWVQEDDGRATQSVEVHSGSTTSAQQTGIAEQTETHDTGRIRHRPHLASRVRLTASAQRPTVQGEFDMHVFKDQVTGHEHVALVSAVPGTLVRVHSECLTGDIFCSKRCDCGPQLDHALDRIAQAGGVLIYLRGHEGRGIGLTAKIRAYALQEQGRDTVDANTELGFDPDAREYGAATAILDQLTGDYPELNAPITLLTNNPEKAAELEWEGIPVARTERILVGRTAENAAYLDTKFARMGHLPH